MPKKRAYLTGPHNVILLCSSMGVDEFGAYAIFEDPPEGYSFNAPSGTTFETTGEDLKVYVSLKEFA